MSTLAIISGRQLADGDGVPYAGAKAYFYEVGSTTAISTYSDSDLATANASPVVADSDGWFEPIWIDSEIVTAYRLVIRTADDTLIRDWDDISIGQDRSAIGAAFYPRTAAEIAASVTPTYYYYEPGDVRRYGAVGDGSTDDTAAIQRAIDTGEDVYFYGGEYRAANLTQDENFQRFFAYGWVRIRKNANGPIITSDGDDVEFNGISFAGDASSPTFTGDNVVLNGENPRLINCGSRWCSGYPVRAYGNHVQIVGTNDIYQTTDSTASGYDIVIGTSGTATLYHRIKGIKSSQSTGGVQFIDTGSQAVEGSQFGKLTVTAGTSPSGVNGGNYYGNRILGDTSINISSAAFSANTFGTATITFAGGTSGHSFDESNILAAGATLTDSSNSSTVIDSRQIPVTSYTPAWTAASVNPSLGNGTIAGRYTKRGRLCTASVSLTAGSTTTFGTGVYRFSLPFIPIASVPRSWGAGLIVDSGTANYNVVVRTAIDGTANCEVFAPNQASPTAPMTWANGDSLEFSVTYLTAS